MDLTGKQKRFLRARGHALKPLLHIGKHGLAEQVIQQVQVCLEAHELVKIKLLESCPLERDECAGALALATGAAVAQTLGRTVLLYRARAENPSLELPPGRARPGAGDPAGGPAA